MHEERAIWLPRQGGINLFALSGWYVMHLFFWFWIFAALDINHAALLSLHKKHKIHLLAWGPVKIVKIVKFGQFCKIWSKLQYLVNAVKHPSFTIAIRALENSANKFEK